MKKIYSHLASNLKTILFTLVMIMLILSFGMWGIGDVIKRIIYSQSSSVEIDRMKISDSVIDANFRNFLRTVGFQNNTDISLESGVKAGLLEQSTKKLVSEIALDKESKKVGININDDLIAKQIAEDPYFKDENGKFDREKFDRVIEYSGFPSEKKFINRLKEEKARIELLSIIRSGVQTSNDIDKLIQKNENQQRSAKYIVLPIDESSVDMSEESIKAYYSEHSNNYRTAELKDLSILTLKRADIKGDDLTAEEIEDELLYQVDLADTLIAEELELEDISSELNIKIQKLTDVNLRDIDSNLENFHEISGAVMDLEHYSIDTKQLTSSVIEASNGDYLIVRVDATKGNEAKPFDEVKEDITKKYLKYTSEENMRKEGVKLTKKINAKETTLEEIAEVKGIELQSSKMFDRLPSIEDLKKLSPVAIAQLFSKEEIGEAGLSIINDGIFLFVLDKIDYKEIDDEDVKVNNSTNSIEYLMVEGFANSLLEKYNAKINYNNLDKMYKMDQDIVE